MRILGALIVLGGLAMLSTTARCETPLVTFSLAELESAPHASADQRRAAWDEQMLAAALQGLANRNGTRLYLLAVGQKGHIDHFWLEQMQAPGGWLASMPLAPETDIVRLAARFRRFYRGVVVWDERVPATANLAVTAAGVESLLPVRFDTRAGSLYDRLVASPSGPRLPVGRSFIRPDGTPIFTGKGKIPGSEERSTGSAKCDAVIWGIHTYLDSGLTDPTLLGYYPDASWISAPGGATPLRTSLVNRDYLVARRGFCFDLGPWDDEAPVDDPTQPAGTDAHTLRRMLRSAYDRTQRLAAKPAPMIHVAGFTPWDIKYTNYTGGRHEGVETEWRYAEILSCFNAFMDADAPGAQAMANASIFSRYPLRRAYPQKNLPSVAALRSRGLIQPGGSIRAGSYAAIYVGDYDSAAWLYQRIPDIWNDPARGHVPLGWAFNPTLAARFAFGMDWVRRHASAADTFVAGDSGAGYLNPGYLTPPRKWSGLPEGETSWTAHCKEEYRRWGLSITGFVIDGFSPPMSPSMRAAYAGFSPRGVAAQKTEPESLVGDTPFLRMGADLSDPRQGAHQIAASLPGGSGARFGYFRTILWSPSDHAKLAQELQTLRPDITLVDPHELFLLLREHLKTGKPRAATP